MACTRASAPRLQNMSNPRRASSETRRSVRTRGGGRSGARANYLEIQPARFQLQSWSCAESFRARGSNGGRGLYREMEGKERVGPHEDVGVRRDLAVKVKIGKRICL